MHRIFLITVLLLSVSANATEKVDILCLKAQENSKKCDEFEIHVIIESGKSTGLRGGYGIVSIAKETNQAAYWTEQGGWSPYSEQHLIKATDPALKKLESRKEFIIFKGTEQQLCKLSNQKTFDIYAWHYGFSDADFNKTRKFTERFDIKGAYLENIWNAIMVYKSGAEKKTSLVYSKECKKGN